MKRLGMQGNVRRFFYQERKLVEKIDRKNEQGKYHEEEDRVANHMTVNEHGRCWSY